MKFKTALAAGILVGTVASAAPASASYKDGVCEGGEVCMYRDISASGSLYDNNTGDDGDLSNNYYVGTSTSVNNSISSIQNLSLIAMRFYLGYNFADRSLCLPPGTASSFGVPTVAYMNDGTSSHRSRPYC